jgi:phage-related holin
MKKLRECSESRLAFNAFLTPLMRLDETPAWGKMLGALLAVWHYVTHDLFGGVLFLVFITGAADYLFGVRAAKHAGTYDPRIAHAGFIGKLSGMVLIFILRFFEHWASTNSLIDTKGALSIALAISLFAVDLQSIAHHRESFGARPIPVLSNILSWLQALASKRVPPP